MTPSRPSPNGEGVDRVFMNMRITSIVYVSLYDALGAQLKSAEEERGLLVKSLLAWGEGDMANEKQMSIYGRELKTMRSQNSPGGSDDR